MNNLAIVNESTQDLKNRILKNREGVLDVLSDNLQGVRACPVLLGEKCIGSFCEMFLELKSVAVNGEEMKFNRCAYIETPLLLIELNQNIRKLTELLITKETKK